MTTATFDAKRAQELFDSGLSCRAIATELGCAPSTVSRWAKQAGLSFDRSKTAMAVRARTVDLAKARQELAQKMALAASDMLDSLDGTYLVYSFGGKDNVYTEHTLEKPPVEVVRNAVVTAGIAFDKATRFLETSDSLGAAAVVSMIERVASAFGVSDG